MDSDSHRHRPGIENVNVYKIFNLCKMNWKAFIQQMNDVEESDFFRCYFMYIFCMCRNEVQHEQRSGNGSA